MNIANSIFVKKDSKLIFNGIYMEAYIPEKLFESKIDEVNGDIYSIMGLFNFKVLINKSDDIDKVKLHTFNFPTMIDSKPNSVEKKEMELIKGQGVQKYNILKYYTDEAVVLNTFVVKDVSNVEKFIQLLFTGNIPNTFAYSSILDLLLKNLEINAISLGVPAAIMSMAISEIYRYKKNQAIPFRKIIGAGKAASQYDYIAANPRTISAFNSTFSALTFEDIDTMLVNSVNKKRYDRVENESPVEQIIKC